MPFGITAANVITWVIFLVIQTVSIVVLLNKFNAKLAVYFEKVDDHGRVLFAKNGELNVLTVKAAHKMKTNCSDQHTTEERHLKDGIDKNEKRLDRFQQTNATNIGSIDKCVAVLKSKVEGGC